MNAPLPTSTQTKLRQYYAEVNRRTAELLTRLEKDGKIYWCGSILRSAFPDAPDHHPDLQEGHDLHADTPEANRYRKAVYLVPSAEPFEPAFAAIDEAQRRALAITGATKARKGLLGPKLVINVSRVRFSPFETFADKRVEPEVLQTQLEKRLDAAKANAAEFERVSDDSATRRLYSEIETLKSATEIANRLDEKLLVRRRLFKVSANVYSGSKATVHYVRAQGLVLAGRKVEVGYSGWSRKTRSDKVTEEVLAPLVSVDDLLVYSLSDWEEAVSSLNA